MKFKRHSTQTFKKMLDPTILLYLRRREHFTFKFTRDWGGPAAMSLENRMIEEKPGTD